MRIQVKEGIMRKILGTLHWTMFKSKGKFLTASKSIKYLRKGLAKMYNMLLDYVKDDPKS